MNKIGEILDVYKSVCREFDINQLHSYIVKNSIIIMSWGFNRPSIIIPSKCYRFSVRGNHHKGYVYIVLNFMDTFTIYYTNTHNVIKKISNDVYIFDILRILDEDIEKVPEYNF